MSIRFSTAPFLTKTYQLVDDEVTDEVVSWNHDGDAFVVFKTDEFARDLLPKYFKHSNFSSFVRQLNTYGFRKTVPDKWEFANQHFKRGQKDLLLEIRRRKISLGRPHASAKTQPNNLPSSHSNSGEDLGSTSMSSPDSKIPRPGTSLFDENEKLKQDNANLVSELNRAKTQCEQLVSFLTEHTNVGPDLIQRVMHRADMEDDKNCDEETPEPLKLFGVWLKCGEKRRHVENGCGGPRHKELRIELAATWMTIGSTYEETGKV